MFIPIRWNTFWQDQLKLQLGFFMFGLGITLMIQASLGTSPWASLDVGVAAMTGLRTGTITQIVGVVILLLDILLREKIGWGTVTNILFIGWYINLCLWLIPKVTGNLPVQILMFLSSILIIGFATAVYISADSGAGPRDSLMIGVSRKFKMSIRVARSVIEVFVLAAGWYIGYRAGLRDHVGYGTIVYSLLIGPSVQFAFKTLRVDPHKR